VVRENCCLGIKNPDLPLVIILCGLLDGSTGMDLGGSVG
jgi:hypothetical protein